MIRRSALNMVAFISFAATMILFATPAAAQVVRVDPAVTGQGIPAGSADQSDWEIVIPPRGIARGRLVVFFPGSGAEPGEYLQIMQTWAADGYHVLGVTLKSATAGLKIACPSAKLTLAPDCFDKFRAESAFGENVRLPDGRRGENSPNLNVTAAKSAANRLLALLDYIVRTRVGEGWDQFRNPGATLLPSSAFTVADWSRLILTGHSQGGGLGLYFGKFFPLAGVGMASAPQDFWEVNGGFEPARWIASGNFATPAERLTGLVHIDEPEYLRDIAAWSYLNMAGALTDEGQPAAALAATQKISTDIQPQCSLGLAGSDAHGATAFDSCTSQTELAPAWRRLVTQP